MSIILVVEDEGIIAKDLQRSLQALGYEVPPPLARGEDAVAEAVRIRPDVVLMDIHLAGAMDGTDAAKHIADRTDAAIVFLTAYADKETLRKAHASSPYGYLVKPFDDETLRTTVATAIRLRSTHEQDRQRLRVQQEALERLGEGVVVTTGPGLAVYANPAASRLIGFDPQGATMGELPGVHDADTGGDPWRILMDHPGEPRRWSVGGKLLTVSAHPVRQQFLVVLTPGDQRASHAGMGHRIVQDFQARASDLI